MRFKINKILSIIISLLNLSLLPFSNCITLDQTGSYNLVVSIDETTYQNSVENYVDNIKIGIQELSDLLHSTTKGKFLIKTASILVPSHWNVPSDDFATSQYYKDSDIKISHRHFLPYVNNPNPCGRPGHDISLPYNFFDDLDAGVYGKVGNALLTQFIRLRFGAWEEHGYPGDTLFPYYWKPLEGTQWEVNACTDVPLVGEYRSIEDGSVCGPDPSDVNNLYPPTSDCRFFPASSQTAKTSMMSYHYLESIKEFCDTNTHNRQAPLPQNYFCKYKSIMEVIETSSDWLQVTQENTPGVVDFKVVKTSSSPLLYVLLDGGKSHAPVSVLSEISSRLKELFTDQELKNLVAGVGKFPSDNGVDSFSSLVPWSTLSTSSNEFLSAFDSAFGTTSGLRNFPAALMDIISEIRSRDHKEGAVILVVKTGAEPNTGDLTTELQIMAGLLTINIKVCALEVQGNEVQPGIALANLVGKTKGEHLTIGSLSDLQTPMTNFLTKLKTELKSPIQIETNLKLTKQEIFTSPGEVTIKMKGINSIQAMAIPIKGEIANPGLRTGNFPDLNLKEFMNWGETKSTSKKTFFVDYWINNPVDLLHWGNFSFDCISEDQNCQVLFVAFCFIKDPSVVFDDVSISISTSAINNEVDLGISNALSDVNAAFAIYAKVEQSGTALKSKEGLSVKAQVYLEDGSAPAVVVDLIDDGKVVPDISLNDGVFSGIYIPSRGGIYRIIVTAKYTEEARRLSSSNEKTSNKNENSSFDNSIGKLFPIDQNFAGCADGILGCSGIFPDMEFTKTVEMPDRTTVINSAAFITFADRIHDFRITPESGNKIVLEWTHPGERGPESGLVPVNSYEIRHSDSFDELLYSFETSEILNLVNPISPGEPGTLARVDVEYGIEAKKYFAIRSQATSNVEDPSLPMAISVIASANIQEDVVVTTTTTTTTVSPSTSTTTTTPSPSDGTGSTPDNGGSPTTVQSTRTSTARPTTTKPITTTTTKKTTTTEPPKTTEPPEKHWFQKKEGIITISVFSGSILLLLVGGLAFLRLTKFR